MKVAILGASGIGRNHARWLTGQGAQVVSFLGTTSASVERTTQLLASTIGFAGQGYTDLQRLLNESSPDAVCVSTPDGYHYLHAKACLERGLPTLCEKPLVYDRDLDAAECCRRAHELVHLAHEKQVLFGTQMQYVFSVPALLELAGVAAEDIETFSMVMETKNLMPGRTHRVLWVDLAPHPLSLLQTLLPGAELTQVDEYEEREQEITANLRLRRPDGRMVAAHITVGCRPGAEPRREVHLNGRGVKYAAFRDDDGEFRARLTAEGGEPRVLPDFVQSLMANFVAAVKEHEPLHVTGDMGAKNLEWLLKVGA